MSGYKILMSNLGYARGFSGAINQHLLFAHRHFYCSPATQKLYLQQLSSMIVREDPDICCFVEIDKGSFTSGGFNQLQALINETYAHFHIENKYGAASWLRKFFITKGKSNAFMAKRLWPHEVLYFAHGIKRLLYKISLEDGLTLFFGHFSLNRLVRARQLMEARQMMDATAGEAVLLGDFNILTGVGELEPLLADRAFVLMNQTDVPTFTFHKRRMLLDLCICSPSLAERAALRIVPQAYSDHAALLLTVRGR